MNNPRCHARTRTGEQCKKPAMGGLTVCLSHGGATKRSKAKAARLLSQTALPAVITLRNIMLDENTNDSLKVKTALGLLDRIPGFGRNSQVETSNPVLEDVFRAIFRAAPAGDLEDGASSGIDRTLSEDMQAELATTSYVQPTFEDIEDAEVVDDEPSARDLLPQIIPPTERYARATVRPSSIDPPRRNRQEQP